MSEIIQNLEYPYKNKIDDNLVIINIDVFNSFFFFKLTVKDRNKILNRVIVNIRVNI